MSNILARQNARAQYQPIDWNEFDANPQQPVQQAQQIQTKQIKQQSYQQVNWDEFDSQPQQPVDWDQYSPAPKIAKTIPVSNPFQNTQSQQQQSEPGGLNDYLLKQGGGRSAQKSTGWLGELEQSFADPAGSAQDSFFGGLKGLANFADGVGRLTPIYWVDRMFGRPTGADYYNRSVKDFNYQTKHQLPYNLSKGLSEAVASSIIPGGNAGTLGTRIATGALQGAGTNALLDIGEQSAEGKPIDLGKTAMMSGIGILGGGFGGALSRGLEKVGEKFFRRGPKEVFGTGESLTNPDELMYRGSIDRSSLSQAENEALDTIISDLQRQAQEAPTIPSVNTNTAGHFVDNMADSAYTSPHSAGNFWDNVAPQDMQPIHPYWKNVDPDYDPARDLVSQLAPATHATSQVMKEGEHKLLTGQIEQTQQLPTDIIEALGRTYGHEAPADTIQYLEDGLLGMSGIRAPKPVPVAAENIVNQTVPEVARSIDDELADLYRAAPSAPPEVLGEYRYVPEVGPNGVMIHGQDRGSLGDALDELVTRGDVTPDEAMKILNIGGAKLGEEDAKLAFQTFAGRLAERFGENNKLSWKGFNLTGPTTEKYERLAKTQAETALKDKYADVVNDTLKGGGPRSTIDKETLAKMVANVPELLDDLDANYPAFHELYLNHQIAEATAKAARAEAAPMMEAIQKRLQAQDPSKRLTASVTIDGRKVNVEYANPRRERVFLEDEWNKHFNKLEKQQGPMDEASKQAIRQKFYEEKAAQYPELARTAGSIEKFSERAATNLADFGREMEDLGVQLKQAGLFEGEKKVPGKATLKPGNTRKKVEAAVLAKATNAMLFSTGAALASSDQSAQAYSDGGDPGRRIGPVAAFGGGLMLIGAARMMGREAFDNFVKNGGAKLSRWLGDTQDQLELADRFLDTNIAATIQKHRTDAARTRWGVAFDSPTLRAQAAEQLKTGLLDANEALAGKAGTAFEQLNVRQRAAVVLEQMQRSTLSKELLNHIAKFRAYTALSQGADVDKAIKGELPTFSRLGTADRKAVIEAFNKNGKFKATEFNGRSMDPTLAHLDALEDSLTGKGDADWLAGMTGSAMDYLFGFNLPFQMLNLTDSIIAGGSRIGAWKVGEAHQLLATDKEIQSLFKNSNLIGSYKQDALQLAAQAGGKPGRKLADMDFSADPINANAVALGSFLNSHQKLIGTGADIAKKDFLKAIIQNEPTGAVSQQVIDDTWNELVDHELRTLGLDSFNLNKSILGVVPGARHIAAFTNQPARIARLVNEYVRNGEYGKLGTLFGITAAIGGKAALPVSVRALWESWSPETALPVESALDDLSMPSLVGGAVRAIMPDEKGKLLAAVLQRDMSRKLEYDVQLFSMARTAPGLQAAFNLVSTKDAGDLATGFQKGPKETAKAAKKLYDDAAMLGLTKFVPGLRNIPPGLLSRLMSATGKAIEGEQKVYETEGTPWNSKIVGSDNINYDQLPTGRLTPFLDLIAPGQNSIAAGKQDILHEKAKRAGVGRKVEDAQQAYQDLMEQLVRHNRQYGYSY